MKFSYSDLMELPIEDVNSYYGICVDKQIYDSIEQMGLHSIDYKDKEKCGTDFYKNYLDELESRNDPINDIMAGLSNYAADVHPLKIKAPSFLINKKKKAN